tara:strand:+ start:39487 stop:39615 length:129 start_codon:yes stop_codon:yes gene_type:complete
VEQGRVLLCQGRPQMAGGSARGEASAQKGQASSDWHAIGRCL